MHSHLPRYLFYADNIIVFLDATSSNGRYLQKILSNYDLLLGQAYSPPKSKIYYSRKAGNSVQRNMRRLTGIKIGSLPFTYLGVSIFRGKPKNIHLQGITLYRSSQNYTEAIYLFIADETIQKFSRWKGNTLSLAGRRCLINSIIIGSLVHSMMVYKWHTTLLRKLETAIRNFLWTGDIQKRGAFNVNWMRCCAPIDEGRYGG